MQREGPLQETKDMGKFGILVNGPVLLVWYECWRIRGKFKMAWDHFLQHLGGFCKVLLLFINQEAIGGFFEIRDVDDSRSRNYSLAAMMRMEWGKMVKTVQLEAITMIIQVRWII